MRRRTAPRRVRGEDGYAAILVAALAVTILLPLCALAVDVSRWYVEIERVQNAADAAAAAGVTYLPDDVASARSTAQAVAARNGYAASSLTTVTVSVGAKPTQLVVTVRTRIQNAFGSAFNQDWATIERSAVADYNGPAPMGSPCNSFGNEPPGAVPDSTDAIRGPDTSVIVAPTGGAACSSNPQMWGAIAGPDTAKANGDEFMTRSCSSGNSGCSGTTNTEFDPEGYFYIVRVAQGAVGTPVTLQVYDPAFIESGDTCDKGPSASSGNGFRNNANPHVPTDGVNRYNPSANTFCTGDVLTSDSSEPPVTSYVLRSPTDTYDPRQAPAISACERQYDGYKKSEVTSNKLNAKLNSGNPNPVYNEAVAQVFHQWVALCTFTPSRAGDYYLQVRTDVALGGTSDGQGGMTGNPRVWTQTGDDTSVKGNGNNRFALRVKGPQRGSVSVAGWDHMSIYANYSGAQTTFNLVRVIPAAATETLDIGFFDVGDASNAGTITVLPPLDSNLPASLTGCRGSGVVNGALSGCQLTNVSSGSGWNGRSQTISVPIPGNYTCNATQPGGCWFRLQVAFPGGVSDTTTWTASIEGNPVRLIQ